MSPTPPSQPELAPSQSSKMGFGASVLAAFSGAALVLRTERNARIESTIAVIALLFSVWLRISWFEWLVVVMMIVLVLGLEMINTAIEAAVDLAHPAQHPLAKKAKDSAAGAVLVAAIGSVIIGAAIFLPRLWSISMQWLY